MGGAHIDALAHYVADVAGKHLEECDCAQKFKQLLPTVPVKNAHTDLPHFNIDDQLSVDPCLARRHDTHDVCQHRGRRGGLYFW